MKVYVTGSEGFLGRHVVEYLSKHGIQVDGSDIRSKSNCLDVRHYEKVIEELNRSSPDVVIHLAALVGGHDSLRKPYEYIRVNTFGTLNILEACRTTDIPNLIYMSSFSPYGKTNKPITETTEFNPQNPYGSSKAAAEEIVRIYAKCYGIKVLIFRACLLAGEYQTEYNALQEFVDCALSQKPIIIYGDGRHKREWLHPQDVAQAYYKAFSYFEKMTAPYDVFVLGSGEPISMKQLAELVSEITDGSTQITFLDKRVSVFDQVTDTSKVRDILKWKPSIPTREIVSRVVKWRSTTKEYGQT
jgi:nucleoside-diphosphate-sugar epimerase